MIMTLSQYIREYVFKKGGKVFPTYKEYCNNNQIFEVKTGALQEVSNNIDTNNDNGLILPSMLSSESEDSDD